MNIFPVTHRCVRYIVPRCKLSLKNKSCSLFLMIKFIFIQIEIELTSDIKTKIHNLAAVEGPLLSKDFFEKTGTCKKKNFVEKKTMDM